MLADGTPLVYTMERVCAAESPHRYCQLTQLTAMRLYRCLFFFWLNLRSAWFGNRHAGIFQPTAAACRSGFLSLCSLSPTTFWPIRFFGLLDVFLSSSRVLPNDWRVAVLFDHSCWTVYSPYLPSLRQASDIGANFSPALLNTPMKCAVLPWMFCIYCHTEYFVPRRQLYICEINWGLYHRRTRNSVLVTRIPLLAGACAKSVGNSPGYRLIGKNSRMHDDAKIRKISLSQRTVMILCVPSSRSHFFSKRN